MIKNSVPIEAIPAMSPEEKQNHTIGLLTSIDLSLKKLLMWAEPPSFGNQIEIQYEKVFGKELDFDLAHLSETAIGTIETAITNAPAKPAPRSRAKTATAPVAAPVAAHAPAAETTLNNAPAEIQAPADSTPAPAAPVSAPITIDQIRSSAHKFIIELTRKGQNGKETFSDLLKAQGVAVLTALDTSKYSILLAKMINIEPSIAAPAAPEAFDPLA
jgi:hypothetical protein